MGTPRPVRGTSCWAAASNRGAYHSHARTMRPMTTPESAAPVPSRRDRLHAVARVARHEWAVARAVLWFIGMAVLGVVGVYAGAVQVTPAWRAAHGQGVPGTVTITSVYCHAKGGCERHGLFRPDSSGQTQGDVELVGVTGDVGDQARVFAESDSSGGGRVYGTGWRALTEAGLNLAFGLACLAVAMARAAEPHVLRRNPSTGRHARPNT